ncbi:metal-dependent amidase/aminoacylase/carboxypeptidase [Candidatus Scalindua japonica]|uniref:Metal-dependent amidase/aminoacylase/carboxypeptidase n=1 Tax=Candidatus Scalindua japonica TaxID=1284222 RepID=A0A286TTP3_9BACT|nr:hypothetical protein [Candidatus Scalindua japonica]GAX59231.1 metal-dependent amidase/aminoacylase/carboxypeptidase [Candidatus Scalindua japonica]
MSDKQKEKNKIYIAIGLAVIMVVLCYFRLIHKKGTGTTVKNNIQNNLTVTELDVPEVNTETLKKISWRKKDQVGPLPELKRDIFDNTKFLKKAEKERTKSSPENAEIGNATISSPEMASELELKGTVVGGKNPIAIINNKFVRVGDLINDYTLVRIGKKEVILVMNDRTVKVEMLRNE